MHYDTSWVTPETAVVYKGKIKQNGIYVQDQIDFGEKWTATLNGHKDWYITPPRNCPPILAIPNPLSPNPAGIAIISNSYRPRAKDKQTQHGWNTGAGVRYIGSRYNTSNKIKLSGVWLADASIRYNANDWEYKLNVRNLFDKFYEASAYSDTETFQGEERTFILTATRRW